MMSDISGIRDISVSMGSRGTSITRVSTAARIGIDHAPPLRKEISPMNCVGPNVEGKCRSSVKGLTTSISPSST